MPVDLHDGDNDVDSDNPVDEDGLRTVIPFAVFDAHEEARRSQ
jgi:hypothetical protein